MPRSTNISLSPKQIMIVAIIGAILWFCAAMLMRAVVKMEFYEGMAVAIVYALTIPGTIPFVILVRRLAGLHQDQIAIGYTVATAIALMLDGAAFALFSIALCRQSGGWPAGRRSHIMGRRGWASFSHDHEPRGTCLCMSGWQI